MDQLDRPVADDTPRLAMHVVLAHEGEKPHPMDVQVLLLPLDCNPWTLLADACGCAAIASRSVGVPTEAAALQTLADRFKQLARAEDAYPTGIGPARDQAAEADHLLWTIERFLEPMRCKGSSHPEHSTHCAECCSGTLWGVEGQEDLDVAMALSVAAGALRKAMHGPGA
jgi:hypothetical protein